MDLGQQGQRRRSGFILFLHLLRFLDFQPSIYVWASFLFFSRRTDIYSITALSYLFKHHSCPSDCQTQIMTRVDLHISRLNTSLKRRKICRSSEREKYAQNVFIIPSVKIFTLSYIYIHCIISCAYLHGPPLYRLYAKLSLYQSTQSPGGAESQQNKHKSNNSNSEDQRLAQKFIQSIFISKDVQRTLAFI